MGPLDRDGRKDGVQTDTAWKQPINIGAGVIEATTGDPGQTHCESADRRLVADLAVGASESVATVDPHTRPCIDQDIGDLWIGEQRLERTGAEDLSGQLSASPEDTSLPKNDGLTVENLRDQNRCGRPA